MTTRFINQKVREYPMTATIEYYVAIDDALAAELEANGELEEALEYMALPGISLQAPDAVECSESIKEHAERNVLLWELSEVDSYSAQVDGDSHSTYVYDQKGKRRSPVDEMQKVETGKG